MKYLDTAEFIRLARYAEAAGFNRRVDPEWIEETLAEDGKHLAMQEWPHHERGMRLLILCKSQDDNLGPEDQPKVWLDISDEDYNNLPDAINDLNKAVGVKKVSKTLQALENLRT